MDEKEFGTNVDNTLNNDASGETEVLSTYKEPTYQEQPTNNQQTEQQANYQQTYTNYSYTPQGVQNTPEEDETPLTLGNYIVLFLIYMIPCCVGVGFYIYWSFAKGVNVNKRNFCRAYLIITLASLVIGFIVYFAAFASIMSGIMNSGMYYDLYY